MFQFASINYHYVNDASYPRGGIYPVSTTRLAQHISALGRTWDFVSLAAVQRLFSERPPLRGRYCLLSFDDGLKDHLVNALPVLRDMKVPAAFFVGTAPLATGRPEPVHQLHWLLAHVPADELMSRALPLLQRRGFTRKTLDAAWTAGCRQYRYDDAAVGALKYLLNFMLYPADRRQLLDGLFRLLHPGPDGFTKDLYMDARQVSALSRHAAIGCHGHEHTALTKLPVWQARIQLQRAKRFLENLANTAVEAVSYPYGGPTAISARVSRLCFSLGFKTGFTMTRKFNTPRCHPMLLGRFDANEAGTVAQTTAACM